MKEYNFYKNLVTEKIKNNSVVNVKLWRFVYLKDKIESFEQYSDFRFYPEIDKRDKRLNQMAFKAFEVAFQYYNDYMGHIEISETIQF